MATHKLLLLPGDGIGPEVMGEVKRLIDWLNSAGIAKFETDTGLVGGSAYDAHKVSISEGDMAKAMDADAIIFGAVGGPKWDAVPYEVRPEAGLLRQDEREEARIPAAAEIADRDGCFQFVAQMVEWIGHRYPLSRYG